MSRKRVPPVVRFMEGLGISPVYRPSVQYLADDAKVQQEVFRVLEEPTVSTSGVFGLLGRWSSSSRTSGRLQGSALVGLGVWSWGTAFNLSPVLDWRNQAYLGSGVSEKTPRG